MLCRSAFLRPVEITPELPRHRQWESTIALIPAEMDIPGCFLQVLRYGVSEVMLQAQRMGMDDYVRLPLCITELQYRLQRSLCRDVQGSGRTRGPGCYDAPEIAGISYREQIVLDLLRANPGRPIERSVLCELYGAGDTGSRGIDMCISRLRRRLQQSCCGESIRAVRGIGYLLEVHDTLLT